MRFGLSYAQKSTKHKWFAWFPVRLENGQIAWLERVDRIRTHVNVFEWVNNQKYYVGQQYNWEYS